MPFIEAPTTFYLGRQYDPTAGKLTDEVMYYDSRHLTTHAVVVGMTGSGKTGLCISLLEEAALDNIPAIVIDPKGDITNLLLNFPELRPADFEPWVNIDDARRAGLDVPQFAADVAHRWREGLASWGISQDRMRWLKLAAQMTIYTPGSDAGMPVSILASLRAPRNDWNANLEANRERLNGITTALLSLIGRNAQPVQDKEHVLIANIFEFAWSRGQDLTLEDIILQVQRPPFDKLGVFPIDEYISERARGKLAMELNNIVASPAFQSWISGVPMDIQTLLYGRDGRPRISIFYTAHLNDTERQFVMTLMLENILGWMRSQNGTTSLRAILYIDEIFGYFPPHPKNPPTKDPMLRLLKQARAFGLGLILATQNPADLDYKGLSNAGTWFIGRLQSEFDQRRVMAGLASLAEANSRLNLQDVSRIIQDIPPRVFLVHNVHNETGPVMMHTRWAMSYLRGPLTRQQIGLLMQEQRAAFYARLGGASAPAAPVSAPPPTTVPTTSLPHFGAHSAPPPPPSTLPGAPTAGFPPPPATLPGVFAAPPPPATLPGAPAYTPPPQQPVQNPPAVRAQSGLALPPGYNEMRLPVNSAIAEYFLPITIDRPRALRAWEVRTGFATANNVQGITLGYRPFLLAQVAARYQDRRTSLFTTRQFAWMIPEIDRAGFIQWDQYEVAPFDIARLSSMPADGAIFGDVPAALLDPRRYTALRREVSDLVYASKQMIIPFAPDLNLYGDPDGDFAAFRAQVQQRAREGRDAEMDALTAKYEKVVTRMEQQEQRLLQRVQAERRELSNLKREQLFTTGEAVLSLLNGRTAYTLSRMSRSGVYKERSKGQLQGYELDLQQLEDEKERTVNEYQADVARLNDKWARAATNVQEYRIQAFKKDITVEVIGIGWLPFWYAIVGGQPVLLEAYDPAGGAPQAQAAPGGFTTGSTLPPFGAGTTGGFRP